VKTLEFWARLGPDRTLVVPPEIAARIDESEPVRVAVILPETDEPQAWADLTTDEFLRGYEPGDDLYDKLPTG
jgi:hypothetical protein